MSDRWLYLAQGVPMPAPLFRYDKGANRFYARVSDGQVIWYPSVTTVIRATSPTPYGLLQWYAKHGMDGADTLRDAAAERGTLMHKLFACYLMGDTIDIDGLDEFQAKALIGFDAFCREREVEPLAIEVLLHSDVHIYAGTADLVCRMNWRNKRILALVDFKSGENIYRDHGVQLEMYKAAWEEIPGAEPIAELFNWAPKDWRKDPSYTLKPQTGVIKREEIATRAQLYRHSEEVKPKGRTVMAGQLPGGVVVTEEDPDDVIRKAWGRLMGDDAQVSLFPLTVPGVRVEATSLQLAATPTDTRAYLAVTPHPY